jgi:putative transcriptional regulator
MGMKKKYQSEQLMACHETAQALFEIGAITKAQMREFDEDCLVPDPAPKANSPQQPPVPAYTHSQP